MLRFRGGLVFKAHRRFYHSTLGLRVIKQKKKYLEASEREADGADPRGYRGTSPIRKRPPRYDPPKTLGIGPR